MIPSGGGQNMRRAFGKVVVGSLLLALSPVMCWAQTPKSEAVRDSSGAAADVTGTNATIVQTVTGATLHLADAVADLDEKNVDSARSKIVLAVEAMRELTAALWSEQDKADPLTRDLQA